MGVEWIMLSEKQRCIVDEIESGNVTSYIPKRFFSDVQAYVVICIDNVTETRRGGVFPSKCAIETNAKMIAAGSRKAFQTVAGVCKEWIFKERSKTSEYSL